MARRERETWMGAQAQRRPRPRLDKMFSLPDGKADPVLPNPHNVGRNTPCPCGSGKKFKHCHLGPLVVVEGSSKPA